MSESGTLFHLVDRINFHEHKGDELSKFFDTFSAEQKNRLAICHQLSCYQEEATRDLRNHPEYSDKRKKELKNSIDTANLLCYLLMGADFGMSPKRWRIYYSFLKDAIKYCMAYFKKQKLTAPAKLLKTMADQVKGAGEQFGWEKGIWAQHDKGVRRARPYDDSVYLLFLFPEFRGKYHGKAATCSIKDEKAQDLLAQKAHRLLKIFESATICEEAAPALPRKHTAQTELPAIELCCISTSQSAEDLTSGSDRSPCPEYKTATTEPSSY